MTQGDVVAISNGAADTAGIPRILTLACFIAESALNPNARRPSVAANDQDYWPDVSFGLGQQTVRWAAEYSGGAAYPGEAEIERVGAFYLIPAYAAAVAAKQLKSHYHADEDDAVFKALCRYNWPAGDGEPASAATAANYRAGIASAQAILGVPPVIDTVLAYNPDQPPERQIQNWACSIRTVAWMLKSLGVQIEAGDLQDEMVPVVVTPAVGLLDGRGNGLAAIMRRHVPESVTVTVAWAPDWETLTSLAGSGPIGLGSGSLYHWFAVASPIDATTVRTANPAPNYPPGGPLGDTLTRDQFNQYAPWAMVRGSLGAAPAPSPAPPAQPDAFIVGPGLAGKMAALGDRPASSEQFLDLWSEAVGASGIRYVYYKMTGEIAVYPPPA